MATPKTIAFHTLGCKLNYAETSTLSQQFSERGYQVVRDDEPADIFVLNTCSVTDFADRKCRKAIRQALRHNPGARVVVTGCYAQLQPEEIAEIPGVDLVLGAGHKFMLLHYVEALDQSTDRSWIKACEIAEVTEFHPSHSFGDRTRSFLKVQDGCDYKCAFCTIPRARGRSRSARIHDVVSQARLLEEQGVKEIVLTGVNIGDFGANSGDHGENFLQLMRALDTETDVERYRISSIEPNLCNNAIIEFVSGSQRFMPHFHMPLQSGCDRTLRRMRRRYGSQLYADRVMKIKSVMPHACIGADVIVGFPDESNSDFVECLKFIRETEISYLHVFSYSERPNTAAESMANRVPIDERRTRRLRLHRLSDAKQRQFYQDHTGQKRKVLLERSRVPDELTGFTDNYIKISIPKKDRKANEIACLTLQHVRAADDHMICS
jgi:threonylcarbamoyladenosine tRNA methylthiotransferase MtaB